MIILVFQFIEHSQKFFECFMASKASHVFHRDEVGVSLMNEARKLFEQRTVIRFWIVSSSIVRGERLAGSTTRQYGYIGTAVMFCQVLKVKFADISGVKFCAVIVGFVRIATRRIDIKSRFYFDARQFEAMGQPANATE